MFINDDRYSTARRVKLIARYLSQRHSISLQEAALDGLVSIAAPQAIDAIVAACPSLSGRLQVSAIDGLLSMKNGPLALLAAVESDQFSAAILNASQRAKLLAH